MTARVDGEDVLAVRDLHTYFPVKSRGILPRTVGQVKAVELSVPPIACQHPVPQQYWGETGCTAALDSNPDQKSRLEARALPAKPSVAASRSA